MMARPVSPNGGIFIAGGVSRRFEDPHSNKPAGRQIGLQPKGVNVVWYNHCMSEGQPSLLLLIDGYNVVAPSVPPARRGDANWLHRERMRLIDRLVKNLDEDVRERTAVVFDAANPPSDRPNRFTVSGIDIRFAVGYAEADDLIEEMIAAHSAPKRLAVVSSDVRIQTAASRRGCTTFASDVWLDDLLEGKPQLAIKPPRGAGQGSDRQPGDEKPQAVSDEDLQQWMQDFGFDQH
jgi:hypothetical protein